MTTESNDRGDVTARDEERQKRKTVIVTCGIPNGLQIALHQVHKGFMGAETRVPHGDMITLKPGDNPDIDAEWFEAWRGENSQFAPLVNGLITWVDGPDYEPPAPAPREGVYAQPQSQPDSIEEMRQPGDAAAPLPDAETVKGSEDTTK